MSASLADRLWTRARVAGTAVVAVALIGLALPAAADAASGNSTSGVCNFGGGNVDTVTVVWAYDFDTTTNLIAFHPVTIAFRQSASHHGYVTTIKRAAFEWQNGRLVRAKTTISWPTPYRRYATVSLPTTGVWSWSDQTDYFVLVALVNRNGATCLAKVPFRPR